MKIFNFILLLILTCLQNNSKAQMIGDKDFQINGIGLKMYYGLVIVRFGNPESVKTFNDEWRDFTAYHYPHMVIWSNNRDRRIWTIDMYDTNFVTYRGVKIGDSVEKIDTLYPTKEEDIHHREFNRAGPYDTSFENYSEYRLYVYKPSENEEWVLIFFTNKNILTKILFYVAVSE